MLFKVHHLCDSLSCCLLLSVCTCNVEHGVLLSIQSFMTLLHFSPFLKLHSLSMRIATPSHSAMLSLFLVSLLPLVPLPPSLPVIVNLTPANTGSSKCTTNRCWYCICWCVTGKRQGEKPGMKSRELYDQVDTKDTYTHPQLHSK